MLTDIYLLINAIAVIKLYNMNQPERTYKL